MLVCGGRVTAVHAFERQAIAGEGIVGFLGDEIFEHLASGFLLCGRLLGHVLLHCSFVGTSRIIRGRGKAAKRNKKRSCMKAKKKEREEAGVEGKPVSASQSEMTEIVLPAQTNPLGKLLGGQVMHLVDMAAAMAAHRHSGSYVVTASVDYIDFRNPVNLGEIVILKSQVNRVFHTSLEVGVEVYSENVLTGEKKHTTSAFVTFVAIDEHTRLPKPVPPLIVKTEEEKRRFHEAGKRREVRLALRYGKK